MTNMYENHCVAFIDILGFKEMTKDVDAIERFTDILNDALNEMKLSKDNRFFTNINTTMITIQVADSLVMIFPKDFYNCYDAIIKTMRLQFLLAVKGVYVRGSINSGAMYVDTENDIYFGEAWNKAVESEKEAINPRIILENDLGKFIESQLRERFNESVGEFYLDVDGKYVLSSYEIGAAFDYGKQIFEDGLSFQLTMINKLEANVTQYILDRRVLQKYLWIIKAIERNAFHPVKEESGELKLKIIECLLNT